jgi:hypothetical protein
MKLGKLLHPDEALSAPAGADTDETDAMVYGGDIYSALLVRGASTERAADASESESSAPRDTVWPFIR